MKQKLMEVMRKRNAIYKLGGDVQIDDAYLGGEVPAKPGKTGRGAAHKTPFVIAVETVGGKPVHLQLRRLPGFTIDAIEAYAAAHIEPGCWVVSDGLNCFPGVAAAVMRHLPIVTGGGRPRHPFFKWVNTALGNIKRLDIEIDFTVGGRFPCPGCGKADCPTHDTVTRMWRHLDFFQHQACLSARVARIKCDDCGVRLVNVPWARPGSGFTLLFEALTMAMISALPVRAAARLVKEHDTRLWRIIIHYVEEALARLDLAELKRVAIDETASRRGHNYISLFVDIDQRKVVYIADGRDADTGAGFADHVEAHGGDASRIKEVCIVPEARLRHDMSGAFIKGVTENRTEADVTFDKFHAVKLFNDAVDEVRRAEAKQRPELKRTRYLWLRNERNLSAAQRESLGSLRAMNLKTARAYHLRLAFQDVYAERSRWWGEHFLDRWLAWAMRCRLEPIKAVARTIRRHRQGILRWFDSLK